MTSKKVLVVLPLLALVLLSTGCGETSVTISDTYPITVCEISAETLVSAEGTEYEIGQSTVNGHILKREEVFEVFTTHFVIEESRDKYVINRVIKRVKSPPEPCP